MRFVRLALILFSLLISISQTSAGVMQVDWLSVGDGKLTRDSAQGLDFLDVTETQGQSFNTVSAELGIGGDYEGFRYATAAEVIALVNNYGFEPSAVDGVTTIASSQDPDQLADLTSLLGATIDNTGFQVTRGFVSDVGSSSGTRRGIDLAVFKSGGRDRVNAVTSLTFLETTNHTQFGSFLVQASPTNMVPEPLSGSLWSGLVLLGLARRRRR